MLRTNVYASRVAEDTEERNTIKIQSPAMVNNSGRNTLDVSKESCFLYTCILLWYTYIRIHRSHTSSEDNRRRLEYNTIKYKAPEMEKNDCRKM